MVGKAFSTLIANRAASKASRDGSVNLRRPMKSGHPTEYITTTVL